MVLTDSVRVGVRAWVDKVRNTSSKIVSMIYPKRKMVMSVWLLTDKF